jgi:competence protein ComEC
MTESYGEPGAGTVHPDATSTSDEFNELMLPTRWLVAAAAGLWWCALHPKVIHLVATIVVVTIATSLGGAFTRREVMLMTGFACLVVFTSVRSEHADSAALAISTTAYTGNARVVDDPQPFDRSTRVIVEVDGRRCELWARRHSMRSRLSVVNGGDYLALSGEIVPLSPDRYQRVRWQHVVCEIQPEWLGDISVGSPLAQASNRVRALVTRTGDTIGGEHGALFRGLVIGDDRDQPSDMLQRFRSGGLSHLTAVSGQNVALILTVATPLIRKMAPRLQLVTTLALIGWFVLITRSEPSILRAGVMASIAVFAASRGRRLAPLRSLALAVMVLIVVDPLLASSVGFHLSVGATFGVIVIGPMLASIMPLPARLMLPVSITLGAQLGVLVPALLVFGRAPLVALPANLLAVPVAGVVMMVGMPVAIGVALLPALSHVVLPPIHLAVWWVDGVARVATHLEPESPRPGMIASLCLAGVVAITWGYRHHAHVRAKHEG